MGSTVGGAIVGEDTPTPEPDDVEEDEDEPTVPALNAATINAQLTAQLTSTVTKNT